jgi:hypothetical protein
MDECGLVVARGDSISFTCGLAILLYVLLIDYCGLAVAATCIGKELSCNLDKS